MIDQLAATAKQVGLELINLSNVHANSMYSWSDVLAQNPGSLTAKSAAGFVNKPAATSGLQMVVDVLTPPNGLPVLRTWGIETKIGEDKLEYVNNIQLTFTVNAQEAARMVSQSSSITRENIRQLLGAPESKLLSITVSNEASGTAQQLTRGERYDFTFEELGQQPSDVANKVGLSLQSALAKLKQAPIAQAPPTPPTPPAVTPPAPPAPPAEPPAPTPPTTPAGPPPPTPPYSSQNGPAGQIIVPH